MVPIWLFALGFAALLLLGSWCGYRLRAEYRTHQRPTLMTVAGVWVLYSLHFGLILIAAVDSTWSISLPRPLSVGAGIFCLLFGAIVCFAAMASFRSLKRLSGMNSNRLITGGIYSWSRNPQNVGWTLFLIGVALLRTSAMILLLAALFWIGFRLYLPLEEQLLERIFGDAYRTYRSQTHRYFGPPKRSV